VQKGITIARDFSFSSSKQYIDNSVTKTLITTGSQQYLGTLFIFLSEFPIKFKLLEVALQFTYIQISERRFF